MEMKGRVTLFHCRVIDNTNPPMYTGYIEYPDGTKQSIRLWHKETPRVTGGEMWTGDVRPDTLETK